RCIGRHTVRQRVPLQAAWAGEGPTRTTLADAFATAVMQARERIRICTPYFLPPDVLFEALRMASRSGIRVEVMLPTCSDSSIADWIADTYVEDLLDAEIAVYCYENGFLHAKLFLVDDCLASVGTANMDYRSLADNWEVTMFIRDRQTVAALSATFDRDLASCRRITRATWHPSAWRRMLGNVLRLASPLM
ncbi:MAG: cardiolipin synthase, partial [Alistipes sp.]|nr:cardiolipin synthase [Alistipes sp.]